MLHNEPVTVDLLAFPVLLPIGQTAEKRVEFEMVHAQVVAAFPLMRQQSLLGFLLLGEKKSGQNYTDEDRTLIQIVINQAALAYERPKLLEEITGAFVHEIKMPLANITLPAELTFMDLVDVESGSKTFADVLPKMKARMKYIMDQALLAGGRVEAVREISAARETVQSEVNLLLIIRSTLNALDSLISRSSIVIELELPDAPVNVLGNPQQLEIVFMNLLKNAVEAMLSVPIGRARRLSISMTVDQREVVTEIVDSGSGIHSGDLTSLFKSHFTTKGVRGTGIGLYVTRQIVRRHGGSIDVRSEEGIGTTFVVRLRCFGS